MRSVPEINVADKIEAHVVMFKTLSENRGVYEIMWKNTVEPNRLHMTIRCMSYAF